MTATEAPSADGPSHILPRGQGVVWFGASGFVNAFGTGFFYPFALLFFTELSGLPLSTVGVVLTIAALAVLPGLPTVGRLIDRFGPRRVLIVSALLRAGCFVGFVATRGIVPLALFNIVFALGNRAEQAAIPSLAVELAGEGQSARWLALSRVVFNAGVGSGALVAGLLVVDSRSGFTVLGVANAVSFVLTAVLYVKLSARGTTARTRASAAAGAVRGSPWRNTPFLRVAGANAVLWTSTLVVETALPVFVLHELALPTWTVGVLFVINTSLLTLLQLPVSRFLERFRPGPVLALGGCTFAVLYVTVAELGSASRSVRLVALLVAMAVYTLGEMAVSQAGLVMLTSLPPQPELGGYMAFNQLFVGVGAALAPLLAASLLDSRPALLWWTLTVLSVLAGLLIPRLPRHATPEPGGTPSS
ncbi:MFS transporter [Streptomyces sp. LaBMicrA B280]|uniref:MFS transporter n=1 Tax=Streptomyces sp. LaBMicrA B280 TaxID=3391001 RepID=UPI003BA73D83